MKRTMSSDIEFRAIKAVCENNPVKYIQNSHTLRARYKRLDEIHFLFMDSYAYTRIGSYDRAEPILTEILSRAIIGRDIFFLVHGNLLLSLCYRNDLHMAKSYLMIAEEYAREAQDTSLLAACLAYQGDYYQQQNNFKLAESLHQRVQKLLEFDEESQIKLPSLLSLTNTSVAAKKYKNALEYLYQALALNRNLCSDQFRMTLHNNLANVLMALKRFTEAEQVLLKARDMSINLKLSIPRIQIVFSLGVLKLEVKLPKQALDYFDECQALALNEGFDVPEFLLDLYNNYAIAHSLNGDIDQAVQYLDKAISIATDIRDVVAQQDIHLNSAKILMKARQYDKAQSFLDKCLQNSKKFKLQDHVYAAREAMADLFLKMKDYPKCVNMMQKVQADLHKQILSLQKEIASQDVDEYNRLHYISVSTQSAVSASQDFIGISHAARKVLHEALLAAQHPTVSVLISGESGTGKEVLAKLIHVNSIRKYHPFIPFNASAISSTLAENELFGHKKGSYTGAITDTNGFFLQANKGTLYIDEITEMPTELQAKILRAIESRRVIPIGSSREISFDCRIISSTNRNIQEQIIKNQFRIDLFHRINTIEITIPPLRDRREDIPVLAEHFINMFCNEFKWIVPQIKTSFMQRLQEYGFPGNIRELKNIIERLFILGESTCWDDQILSKVCNLEKGIKVVEGGMENEEKNNIIKALIRHKGVRRDAAAFLKMSNSTMTRRIEKYNLEGYTSRHQAKMKSKK